MFRLVTEDVDNARRRRVVYAGPWETDEQRVLRALQSYVLRSGSLRVWVERLDGGRLERIARY